MRIGKKKISITLVQISSFWFLPVLLVNKEYRITHLNFGIAELPEPNYSELYFIILQNKVHDQNTPT